MTSAKLYLAEFFFALSSIYLCSYHNVLEIHMKKQIILGRFSVILILYT